MGGALDRALGEVERQPAGASAVRRREAVARGEEAR